MTEADSAVFHRSPSKSVRAAMVLNSRHRYECLRIDGTTRISVNVTCDTAHVISIPRYRIMNMLKDNKFLQQASQQSHADKNGSACLSKIPIVFGIIQISGKLLSSG